MSMSMGDMGGMDMNSTSSSNSSMSMGDSMDMGGGCKISMLWNWYTIDTCFLSSSWHNTTKAKFAGSVIGVFLLVIAIEALRRGMREYDRYLTRRALASSGFSGVGTPLSGAGNGKNVAGEGATVASFGDAACGPVQYTPTWVQHALRSVAYGTQFTVSFLVMLLGMYYNGYILFAIFIGHTVGYYIFGRDTCLGGHPEGTGSGHCC